MFTLEIAAGQDASGKNARAVSLPEELTPQTQQHEKMNNLIHGQKCVA